MSQSIIRGLLLGLTLLPLACVGPDEVKQDRPKRELTADEFRDLLAKGTIQPTQGMVGEDPFKKFNDEGMGDATTLTKGSEPGESGMTGDDPFAHTTPPHKLTASTTGPGAGSAKPDRKSVV